MKVEQNPCQITFGYTTELSQLWKKGKLPMVKKGFYGDILSKNPASPNFATNEHIIPHSQGGPTKLRNIVLSSAKNNNGRGCEPLSTIFNKEIADEYFDQFKDVVVKYKKGNSKKVFDGNRYIQEAWETIKGLLKKEGREDLLHIDYKA